MNAKLLTLASLVIGLCLLTGCAMHNRTAEEFGDAVRQVTEAQVYDTNAALNPDPEPVLGGDPERLNSTLDGYRKEAAAPAGAANQPVTVNIGGN